MGDKKDKEGKAALTKKDVEVERSEVTTPPADGLRRSRRLRNFAPPPPQPRKSEVGGSRTRKRPAGPPKQADNGAAKKERVTDEDDVSAQVNVANRAGKEETSPEPIQPILHKNDDERTVGVEGVTAKRGEAPASSTSSRGNAAVAAGRSEIQSSQNYPKERVVHPCLFIDTILDVIFKHIINRAGTGQDWDDDDDVRKRVQKDVRNIRQVCKFWNTSITRLYRQSGATATFDIGNMGDYRKRGKQTTLTNFLATMRPSQMIPVQKYKFLLGNVLGPNGDPQLFREFLVMCGPEARSLDLTIRPCESEKIMLNLVDLPELDLGELTRLKLTIFENHQVTYQANRIPGNVKLLELLLTAAKSLREFELSYRGRLIPIPDQEDILIKQLVPVIAKRLPASVQHFALKLDLKVKMDESVFDELAVIQSQLESFGMEDSSGMGSKTICKFLKSQATTLQRFHLSGWINGAFADFPRLHNLTHLEMGCNNVNITAHFEFADIFPKLQFLKIEAEFEEPFLTLLSRTHKPLGSLTVLHLPSFLSYIKPGFLKGIAKSFPCLAELHVALIDVTAELMGELFTYFDNLELLNITTFHSPTSMESMFSGIAESECSRIEEAQEFEKENLNELQRGPSLLNMTKLKKLVVGRFYPLLFTDFAAHFVFLEMENLRELQLPKGYVKFSPKYRHLLEAKLDKLVLSEH